MLKTFEIKNFKAFGELQAFNAAPITLIYGPNSGGKSSIIQALMLLRQSIVSPVNQRLNNRYLVLKGPYVDLGQSKSIHHRHNTDRPVSFGAKFDAESQNPGSLFSGSQEFLVEASFHEASKKGGQSMLELTDVVYGARDFMRGKLFRTSLARAKKQQGDVSEQSGDSYFIKAFQFKSWDDVWHLADFAASLPRVRAQEHRGNVLEWLENVSETSFTQLNVMPRPNLMTGKVTFLPFFIRDKSHGETRNVSSEFCSRVLNQIARTFSETFETASYLGPIRNRPRRVYEMDHQYQGSVGVSGEYMIDALAEDLYLDRPHGERDSVAEEVNRWLDKFEIPYSLAIDNLGNEVVGDIATLKLFDKRTKVHVAATDVGFGIGQLLPVIIEGVLSKNKPHLHVRERLICVEQPEIHLHPRLQAHVADFFIDTYKKNGCQWIAETHSEALMLRIQKRVRDGTIKAEDVSVVFVNPTEERGSEIMNLRLDEKGEFIDEWPGGFFEETFREMFF